MQIAVIAEYDPFHKGHAYQIGHLRAAFGEDACITVIMGGIFSQRGAPYIAPPYVRAEAAVRGGADLVLELPFPFSASPAAAFARAGVEIAEKIGADVLAFGSECGDLEKLKSIRARLDEKRFLSRVEELAKADPALSRKKRYETAYETLYGERLTDAPNDLLALAYLRALNGTRVKPYTHPRLGDYHGGLSGDGVFASASAIRCGDADLFLHTPMETHAVYRAAIERKLFSSDLEKLSSAVLLRLCALSPKEDLAFCAGGLAEKLKKAAVAAHSIADVQKAAADKSHFPAEISRAILFALFGVSRAAADAPVSYTRLFAASACGRARLREIAKAFPVLTKPADFKKLPREAADRFAATFIAERAFALSFDGEYDFLRQSPFML